MAAARADSTPRAIVRDLRGLIARRQLADDVSLREGCAGGCYGSGPEPQRDDLSAVRPGERADGIAVSWKTYVYTLATLTCLAQVIEESLDAPPPAPTRTPRGRSARRPPPPAC